MPVSGIESQADVMISILKRKDFARWQAHEKLPDILLCKAVSEMENGLIDADLGAFLYKKRESPRVPWRPVGLSQVAIAA